MDSNNLISIVVPVYKVPEQLLRQCIDSILNQTYKNLEILLIDDGSPDDCGKICDEYANTDIRINVIHKQNGGLSAARNTGVENASGKWIMFVDGDDWIEAEMCSVLYETAEKHSVQVVMCGMYKDYDNSSIPYEYYIEEKLYDKDGCKWLQEQLLHFNGNIATAYCKLILRDYMISEGVYHDSSLRQGAEGIEFNLRLFENLDAAYFINRSFYHYVYNDNSISSSHNEENHKFVIKCFLKIKDFIASSSNKEKLMYWFNNRLLYVIVTTAISGYFNPSNTESYGEKKRKFNDYLKHEIIQEALNNNIQDGLSIQRKMILFMIKHKMFFLLNIMGKIRKIQKTKK